jgi:ABC-type amino acid transport substrate-binding protein
MRLAAVPLALVVLVIACAGATRPKDTPPLRVASDAAFAPFHFLDETGSPTGFEIELAREAGARAGFLVEIVVRAYGDLLPGLAAGDFEIVAATTGVTEARRARYRFSTPYFDTAQVALVRRDADAPATLADLAGRLVGAAGEGTSLAALRGLTHVEQVALGKGRAGIAVLERGEIDALIVDEFDAVAAARASNGRLRVLSEPVAAESYAFVLAAERADLVQRLDGALADLERKGHVAALRARFGLDRDADWPVRLPPARR